MTELTLTWMSDLTPPAFAKPTIQDILVDTTARPADLLATPGILFTTAKLAALELPMTDQKGSASRQKSRYLQRGAMSESVRKLVHTCILAIGWAFLVTWSEGADASEASCSIPEAIPAATSFNRCSGTAICRMGGKDIIGWVPRDALTPVGKVPSQILENAKSLGGPGLVTSDSMIRYQNIVYGINPVLGGGYGVYFSVDGGKTNEARFGFGDGWQASIRDRLHDGNWNPTQAGSGWSIGTPASIARSENGFVIKRYNMANFFNNRFDFLQNDAIRRESGRKYRDRKHSGRDDDGCDNEPHLDDEARSEFDFAGDTSFVSDEIGSRIPVLRFRNYMEYTREPLSVRQFFQGMVEAGRTYVSPAAYQGVVAADTDLSLAIFSWGLRLRADTPFKFQGFIDASGRWQFSELAVEGSERTRSYVEITRKTRRHLQAQFVSGKPSGVVNTKVQASKPFVLLADGTDAQASKAIALYYPYQSPTNKFQTIGVSTKGVTYYEDRLLSASVLSVINKEGRQGGDFVNLTLRLWTSGLLEPRRTLPGVREALRATVYVLYGTPAEILAQVEEMEGQPNSH